MLEGPRAPDQKDLPRIIKFLDQTLRPQGVWSIADEYPSALGSQNIHNMRIISDENEVISHAVMKPLIVKSPHVIFKVGTMGSVVTADAHRNQGHSSKVLEDCIQLAKQQLCDVALLWTDLYDFYRRLGFELAGQEVSFVFESELSGASSEGLRFSQEKNISPDAIWRLYSQHTVSSVRSTEEIRKFLSIPNTQLYTAWNSQNQLMAFAVEGKGADLTGYIHEWGGLATPLVALISHIRKIRKQPLTMILPAHATNLIQRLRPYSSVENMGYLGMIKILNFNQLANKIKRAFRAEGLHQVVLEQRDSHYYLGYKNQLYTIHGDSAITQILFGPTRITEMPQFDEETCEVLGRLLPLPLWVWGWDSI